MSTRRRLRLITEEEARQRVRVRVRRAREAASLSVQEIATRARIHPRHWQKIEAGEANLTIDTLERVSLALGIDVSELLSDLHPRK